MNTADKPEARGKAQFSMVFHCHQPVFNLPEAVEEAYLKAYLPLLTALHDSPGIKATFHFSGTILEWVERNHPELIDLIGTLLEREQIELLGGGYYEPVMSIIPSGDRKRQLSANNRILDRLFGVEPAGAWIAERVWEAGLADMFLEQGIRYSVIDDHHILSAGYSEDKVYGPCRIKGLEKSIVAMPALSRLRYSMPFRPPEVTMSDLKELYDRKAGRCFVFADDGEKFGAWPRTYKWVHQRGWLRTFFKMLDENKTWLETVTCSGMIARNPVNEVGRIPRSSYPEMMEWSEGDFSNFIKKYPEVERMHSRMTFLSGEIGSTQDPEIREYAREELMKAQTGCAYWHGTFGGVYMPFFREGVYRHMIEAANILERAGKFGETPVSCVEKEYASGKTEILLKNEHLEVFIRPEDGGAVPEIDDRKRCMNLLNTMGRRKEKYHDKARRDYRPRIERARKAVLNGNFADIHDVLGVAEKGLEKALFYDDHTRNGFMTHLAPAGTSLEDLSRAGRSSAWALSGDYSACVESDEDFISVTLRKRDKLFFSGKSGQDLEVVKSITMGGAPVLRFTHAFIRRDPRQAPFRYAVEFNMLLRDRTYMSRKRYMKSDRISFRDIYSGAVTEFFLEKEHEILTYPIYTVNESEAGMKKTFQGISMLVGGVAGRGGPGTDSREEIKISLVAG